MNRGEIWWMETEAGRRPGCILTRQAAIPVLTSVLMAPATRTIRTIPTELRLGPEDGMPTECVLSFDNVLTVPKALLVEQITTVRPERVDELCQCIALATGCD